MLSNSYIFRDGYFTKLPQPRTVNYTQAQPHYKKHYECTAAILDNNQHYFPWVTIPCHKKLGASYFCQPSRSSINIPKSVESNVKCDRDWILLHGTQNCLLVLDSGDNKLSFYDSQYVCSLYNASVFKVNTSERGNVAHTKIEDLKPNLMYGMTSSELSWFHHIYPNISSDNIKNILFGRRLNAYSPQSMLPFYLKRAYNALYEGIVSMSFFTEHNHTCSIVEYLEIGDSYRDASYMADQWGVKCRPCAERIKVSGIICEKPTYTDVRTCKKNHFECHDKTCILSIYQCDHTADCFDHSDEYGCLYNNSNTLINQFVKLPCPPNSDCQNDIGNQVRVHDVCDGIYVNDTFLLEKDVCVIRTRKVIMPIRSRKLHTMVSNSFTVADLVTIFWQEDRYKCKELSSLYKVKLNHTSTYARLFQGGLLKQNTKLNDMCLFRDRKYSCQSPSCRFLCTVLACPGMFKCHDHACIPLSYYCDKIHDCALGEDEIICSTLPPACPGSLKCRGERKCISIDDLCDNNIDCFYSMDDELGCRICPMNCECSGYVMSCHANNSYQLTEFGAAFYTKGLLIKGTQQVLTANDLQLIGLLFVNVSYCKLEKVDVSYENKTGLLFLIFTDFSRNRLTTTYFLSSQIFQRTVFLDLSFNLLHTFKYGRSISLTYLSVLYLTGNDFKEITMIIRDAHLDYINLQFLDYFPEIAVRIDHDGNLDLVVAVTDSQLCCLFSVHVKCLSNQNDVVCYGILNDLNAKVSFYCLSLLSLFFSLSVSIKQAFKLLSRDKASQNKKSYSVLLMNQSINNILSSLYLMTILTMDIIKIKLLFLKASIACVFLNFILYNSLETIIIFKSSLSLLIALKIRFPFRHQCPWLKWVTPASGFVWLFIMTTYMMHFFLPFGEQSGDIFDKLCSIAWCEMYNNFNMLLGMVYFVDQLSIFVYMFAFLLTYVSLKEYRNKFKSEPSSKTYSASGVTCKCILANVIEIILRVYMITLVSFKLSHLRYVHFCFSFFLYALPINILFSCFINIFK